MAKMKFSTGKSAVMFLKGSVKVKPVIILKGERGPHVKEYKYPGVALQEYQQTYYNQWRSQRGAKGAMAP